MVELLSYLVEGTVAKHHFANLRHIIELETGLNLLRQ